MDENLNQVEKQEIKGIDTEELKNETKEVIDQVKENMKNVDIKEEAKATKGFVSEMLKNPLSKIHEIANDGANKFFKTGIVLVILWTIVELIGGLSILFSEYGVWYKNLLSFIKIGLRPIVSILVMAFILLWLNKKEKKSLTTYITTIATVKLPIIVADLLSLLTLIGSGISMITGKIYTFANHISIILLFFAIKSLSNEKDDKNAFRKFVIVEALTSFPKFLVSLLYGFNFSGIIKNY